MRGHSASRPSCGSIIGFSESRNWEKLPLSSPKTEPAKFERIFPQKKCRFRPQKTNRIQRKFGIFSKNVAFFSSGVDNSPVGTTTSGICRLLQRNCSLRMRKIPHFLKKFPIFSSNWGSEIGSKYANFSDFWALLPDPETTSLT